MKKTSAIALALVISGVLFLTFHFAEAQPTGAVGATTNLTISDFNNTLFVTVLDAINSSPISNATIRIYNVSGVDIGLTNSSGKFEASNFALGTYIIEARRDEYNSSNASAAMAENSTTSITITLMPLNVTPSPPPPPTAEEGGRAIAPGLVLITKKPGDILTVFQGETVTFIIVIHNTGSTPLTDVRLVIEGFSEIPFEEKITEITAIPQRDSSSPSAFTIPIGEIKQSAPKVSGALLFQAQNDNIFTITPEVIEEIPPGVRKAFFIEMRVPLETPVGNYTLIARATSKETTFIKPILLEVLPAEKKPAVLLIADEIEFLRRNINAIYNEALLLQEKGADVSAAVNLLFLANQTLDKAVEFNNINDFDSARSQVESAKTYIRAAVELLAKVRIPFVNVMQTAVFVSIVVLVLLITAVLYLKHEQKKTYNRLVGILYDIRRLKAERTSESSS